MLINLICCCLILIIAISNISEFMYNSSCLHIYLFILFFVNTDLNKQTNITCGMLTCFIMLGQRGELGEELMSIIQIILDIFLCKSLRVDRRIQLSNFLAAWIN